MGSKRKLIDELLQGVESMKAQREGRAVLRTNKVQRPPCTMASSAPTPRKG